MAPLPATAWAGPRSEAPDGPNPEPRAAPATEGVQADLEAVLEGRGRAYLEARGRLEAQPEATRAAVLQALDALDAREATLRASVDDASQSQAFGDIDRRRGRLVALLAQLRDPADAPRFATQLRSALVEGRPADPWRPLLLDLGPAAVPALARLVGDTELSQPDRQQLLEDLVNVTPAEQLGGLTAQLGRGDRELERTLRRALVRRSRAAAASRDAIVAALDATLGAADVPGSTRAAALLVRARVAPEATWLAKAGAYAADPNAPFELRIAALEVLRTGGGDAELLTSLAQTHLAPERRAEQRSEIIAWMALRAMPEAQARELVARYQLRRARAPRLASLAWERGELPGGGRWLEDALENPWPTVRVSAMHRIEGPCDPQARRWLAERSGPRSRGGDADAAAARAAVEALGRCEALGDLEMLVDETGISFEQRGVAARTLVEHDAQGGAEFVAARLRPDLPPQLAERFADALGQAPSAGEAVFEALCRTEAAVPTAADSARRSRRKLFPDRRCD